MSVLVSVVIPCFNASKTIEKCIESILSSRLPKDSYEVIVVDNNSTDNSKAIISRFPVTFLSETKQGRSFARNCGILASKGEYVAFVDADVYIDEFWLTEMVNLLKVRGFVAGQGKIIPSTSEGLKSLNDFRYRLVKEDTKDTFVLTHKIVYETPMINSAACMYKKDVLDRLGGFDTSLIRHEDIDLSRRVFMLGGDVGVSFMAKSTVVFHGEGWWDYFKRTFADGFTKVDYIRKWKIIETSLVEQGVGHSKRGVNDGVKSFLYVHSETLKSLMQEKSFHYLMQYTLMMLNTFARLLGYAFSSKKNYNFQGLESVKHLAGNTIGKVHFDKFCYKVCRVSNKTEVIDYNEMEAL